MFPPIRTALSHPPPQSLNHEINIVNINNSVVYAIYLFFLISPIFPNNILYSQREGKKLIQNQSHLTHCCGCRVSSDRIERSSVPLMSLASLKDKSQLYIDCPYSELVCCSRTMRSRLYTCGRNGPEVWHYVSSAHIRRHGVSVTHFSLKMCLITWFK